MTSKSITLLSAILFNSAFFYPDQLGYVIIPALFFFWRMQLQPQTGNTLLWALLVFPTHFIWLYALLRYQSRASIELAIGLYLFVVCYFIVLCAGWFALSSYIIRNNKIEMRRIFILASISCFYIVITHVSLSPFVGHREGYPFLNPCIPLARTIMYFTNTTVTNNPATLPLLYLKPMPSSDHPGIDGQRHFHALCNQKLTSKKIIIAPESFFPFPINEYPEIVALWSCALPTGSTFIFGSQWQDASKRYQTACCITNHQLTCLHHKHHLINFVECMPAWYNQIACLQALFLHNAQDLSVSNASLKVFRHHGTNIMIQICSEFFFTSLNIDSIKPNYIFLLINDRWFVAYFRKIIENLACIKSVWLNMPVVYVGHSSYKLIS